MMTSDTHSINPDSRLNFSDISFSYERNQILEEITFRVSAGEFLSVIGPNGTGKTTLLRLMINFIRPTTGVVTLNGKPLDSFHSLELAKQIAIVPQSENVIFPFPVRSMVMLGRYPYLSGLGFERQEDYDITNRVMNLTGVAHLADRAVTELSGGELHRVIIARALAQDTPILLLDEPNAHLDIKHQIELFNLLKYMNRESSRTIICVTHDLNLAALYSDRIALLNNKRLVSIGTPREVLTRDLIAANFGIQALVEYDSQSGIPRITPLPEYSTRFYEHEISKG